MFCCSSMSVASAEGSRWETAVDMLMLRQSIKDENEMFCRIKKGNTKKIGNTLFY